MSGPHTRTTLARRWLRSIINLIGLPADTRARTHAQLYQSYTINSIRGWHLSYMSQISTHATKVKSKSDTAISNPSNSQPIPCSLQVPYCLLDHSLCVTISQKLSAFLFQHSICICQQWHPSFQQYYRCSDIVFHIQSRAK